ncbi:MAG: 3-coathanger stack domain-containing protein, partial [Saprospiraceae bacterium]
VNQFNNFITYNDFGSSVGISGDDILVWANHNGTARIYQYKRNGSTWVEVNNSLGGALEASAPFNINRIDMTDDYAIVGDWNENDVYFLKKDAGSGDYLSEQSVQHKVPATDNFGWTVAIHGDYAMIGGKNDDQAGTNAGAAWLWKRVANVWTELKKITAPDPSANAFFGYSVDINATSYIIGAKGHNDNQGKIYYFPIASPTNVVASDGDPNKTDITWNYDGSESAIDGFRIHRDGVLIDSESASSRTYSDTDGIPGKEYVYSVFAYNMTTRFESYRSTDKGFKEAEGQIKGNVVTLTGGPVPDVLITATGTALGEFYTYTTTSIGNGTYTIDNVFFNPDNITEYEVSASFPGHDLVARTPPSTAFFDQEPTVSGINFLDRTAFIIKGVISQKNTTCNLEGITITATSSFVNDPNKISTATTGSDGTYSLIIEPTSAGLTSINVSISNVRVLTEGIESSNIYYDFVVLDNTPVNFIDFTNFPIETTINFEDELTYPVTLVVQNTCEAPISQDHFEVRVRTLDGCYDQRYLTTGSNGEVTINLPPLNFDMKVVGVDNQTGQNQLALDFFAAVPNKLNLFDIHKDTYDGLTIQQRENLGDLNLDSKFTYHKAPTINISGFSSFFCNDPTEAAIITQGQLYSLDIDITETHNGVSCSVSEGRLKITNPAAQNSSLFIDYDADLNGFPTYNFIAGDPNPVVPYLHGLIIDYISEDGSFLGTTIQPVFVEGSIAVPGTDVLVDPVSNDQVQYPLFILRDPMGDLSYSAITTTKSFSENVNFAMEEGAEITGFFRALLTGATLGAEISTDITVGASASQSLDFTVTGTNETTFETSDDPGAVGRTADNIIGVGMSMQFGQIQEYRVGTECDHIEKTTKLGITPGGVTTQWSYTVGAIEDIIKGYQLDLIRIEAGTLVIDKGEGELSKIEATGLVNAYIDNWTQILVYHDVKTLPHYLLCNNSPRSGIPINIKNEIKQWQNGFCPLIATKVDDEWVLHDDIEWNQAQLDGYNKAGTAIRYLTFGEENLNEWAYPDGADVGSIDIESFPDAAYETAFGKLAQNFSFGGNTKFTQSIQSVQENSKEFTQSVYGAASISSAFVVRTDNAVGTPFNSITIQDTEIDIGLSASFNVSVSNTYQQAEEEGITIEYHLEDDDPEDLISLAVIMGAAQNHSPYFDLFGGHTSCPPEEGSVFIDDPNISLFDEPTNTAFQSQTKYNVPADEVATFQLRLTNNSPRNEVRDVSVFLDNTSNPDGAIVRINGFQLGGQSLNFSSLQPGIPIEATLTVEKGSIAFDYDNIKIGINEGCSDGGIEKFVDVSIHFTSPCSPVTIVLPDDQWVISNAENKMLICIRDYQPDNLVLNEVILEYRRIGAGTDWACVPLNQLGLTSIVDRQTLVDWNSTIAAGQVPAYYFEWTLPDDPSFYPDGDYEIRVKMDCGATANYSNVVPGKIDRSGLILFGSPEPADGIWITGDEISFAFNGNLDCPIVTAQSFVDANFSLIDKSDNDAPVDFIIACFNNKIIFQTVQAMSTYDGHILELMADNVVSTTGSGLLAPVTWPFRVVTQQLYWQTADTIKLFLYENDTTTVSVQLNNSTTNLTANGVSLAAKDGTLDSWLSFNPAGTFSVTPSGTTIDFLLEANQPLGVYTETVEVNGLAGQKPELVIQLCIIPEAPDWDVNPANFSSSMNIVSNWRFTTQVLQGEMSNDIQDIISVWIDGAIRGSANIESAGNGFFVAYLSISGDPGDENKPLEFRVWDADEGIEYSSNPENEILFVADGIRGNTAGPEILVVKKSTDQAKFIPLNQGWTWFSINTESNDMSLETWLTSLTTVSDGDIIKTGDKFAQYTDGVGWIATGANPLTDMNVHEGYMIFLQNGPDQLRVTGNDASAQPITLTAGWNWIGYPLEEAQNLTGAFALNNLADNDLIKTIQQVGTAPFAQYNIATTQWAGSLTELQPYEAYKINMAHPNGGILTYAPVAGIQVSENEKLSSLTKSIVAADPQDQATWIMNDLVYQYVMPMVGELKYDGAVSTDTNDKVAAFVGNDLRGVGNVELVAGLSRHEVSFLIGGTAANEVFTLYYYNATEDTVYMLTQTISLDLLAAGDGSTGYGKYSSPYLLENGDCSSSNSALGIVGDISTGLHQTSIDITSSGNVKANTSVEFRAGTYIILSSGFNVEDNATFLAIIEPCVNAVISDKEEIKKNK